MSEGALNRRGSFPVCLSVCVQRAALRTPPPFGPTLSFFEIRYAPSKVRTPSPRQAVVPFHRFRQVASGVGRDGTPFGQACTADSGQTKRNGAKHMFNKVILIGRLGQNAEAKTAQNSREYAVLNIATQESWKNDKSDSENRTEWHRVYAWSNLSKF